MVERFDKGVEDVLRVRAKAELRKSVQRIRSTTPASARLARSEAIRARLLELDVYRGVHALALFRPIERKGEVDTAGIDADARVRGIRVSYPSLGEDGAMTFHVVESIDAPDAFEDRGHGFPEPRADAELVPPSSIDLVIVPALAFDPEGNRLGYGAGHYDRFLAACPHAATVGVGFDFQILVEIPIMPGDVPVQRVVTDRRAFVRGSP